MTRTRRVVVLLTEREAKLLMKEARKLDTSAADLIRNGLRKLLKQWPTAGEQR